MKNLCETCGNNPYCGDPSKEDEVTVECDFYEEKPEDDRADRS